MKIKVKVTERDIKKGDPMECGSCPIALALKRQIPDIKCVSVEDNMVFFGLESTSNNLHAPPAVIGAQLYTRF